MTLDPDIQRALRAWAVAVQKVEDAPNTVLQPRAYREGANTARVMLMVALREAGMTTEQVRELMEAP